MLKSRLRISLHHILGKVADVIVCLCEQSFHPIRFELRSLTNRSLCYATSYCGNACGARRRSTTIFLPSPRKFQVYSDCLLVDKLARVWTMGIPQENELEVKLHPFFLILWNVPFYVAHTAHRLGQQKRAEWPCHRIILRPNQELRPIRRWMVVAARPARNL